MYGTRTPIVLEREAISDLSDREQQVLRLLADGLSAKEIADRLAISPSTANIHLCRIYDKLGVHKAVSAVRYAIRVGFIEP